jgi:ComF family protein
VNIKDWTKSLIDIIYPYHCLHCQSVLLDNEKDVCNSCIGLLPFTNFISYQNNPVYKIFQGRIPLEYAFSFLIFEPDTVIQQMLHALKYEGKKSVGEKLGILAAQRFSISKKAEEFPDCITSIPLHPDKLKIRGYNQASVIGQSFADYLNLPFYDQLISKPEWNESQTNKNRSDRWANVSGKYLCVDKDFIKDKHIMVIDDVITTGATMESCVSALLEVNCGVKISVAGIAYTQ